ncbi:MAG TPA: PmoA family protein [Membranihabitans sp.]|nr:PmoA family protein [Membranihabitans sp.]
MRLIYLTPIWMAFIFTYSCTSSSGDQKNDVSTHRVTFQDNEEMNSIDVMIDGQPFTTLHWRDGVTKPVLFPIRTSQGTAITRGYPIEPATGERADHPHQIGNWLTYGNVNGSDFWGNGSRGLGTVNPNGGTIKLITTDHQNDGTGNLSTTANWVDSAGQELLHEKTTYHFIAKDSIRIIDRIVTLTAGKIDVSMPDTKEGMFGIRVARELELPAQGEVTLYSASGEPEKVKEMNNASITGDYLSSEGDRGIGVWGSRARWMDLFGNIDGEEISVVICDHPDNPGYPTWWHARGYGLFAANPLGANDFTRGEEVIDFNIPAGDSVTFRYRIVISSGSHLSPEEINGYADEFAVKY